MDFKQRIRRDAKRLAGDAEASALLACLAEHLFDPDLSATFLARKSGATREVHDRLVAAVGPLRSYATELRMIEAACLVRETELTFPEIGKRLGYRVKRTFRRAFKEHHGMPPNDMREQARAGAARLEAAEPETLSAPAAVVPAAGVPAAGVPAAGAPDAEAAAESALEQLDDEYERLQPPAHAARLRRRLALGLLDDDEAAELRARLRRVYPALEEPAREEPETVCLPLLLMPVRGDLEVLAATAVFDRIFRLPETDLRHGMLEGVRMAGSTAFLAFTKLCSDRSRKSPERAVAMAELGVQLVELHRPVLADDDAHNWLASAWAALGGVKLHAGDLAGADRALDFAREEVPEGGTLEPWVEVELRRMESGVRQLQGRYDQAKAALDHALELLRDIPELASTLAYTLTERLDLASWQGDAETALALTRELEALVAERADDIDRPSFSLSLAAYHRGRAYAALGDDDRAAASWRRADAGLRSDLHAPELDGADALETIAFIGLLLHEIARLAGRKRRYDVYEARLREAIEFYRLAGAAVLEAAAEAELAALCAIRGRVADARRLAASAADFLDRLPSHRRAWTAARWLRALENGGAEAPADVLWRELQPLCADLDTLRWEITGPQAAPAARARAAERREAGA